MSAEKNNVGRMLTPEARVLYPHLFEPRTEAAGRKLRTPQYEADLVFDTDAIDEMKREAIKVAHAKWPGRDLKTLKFPFKAGNQTNAKRTEKAKKPIEAIADKIVLKVKAAEQYPPQVVDHNGDQIINRTQVYSGCYGFAEINFVAYDGNGEEIKDGVTVYINAFMKSRDGEKVGGRDAKQIFAGVIGKQTQEDPTAGLDDEIPF